MANPARTECTSFVVGGYSTGAPSGLGACPWCSNPTFGNFAFHNGPCPRVKEIEYHPNGSVKRVVFNQESSATPARFSEVLEATSDE